MDEKQVQEIVDKAVEPYKAKLEILDDLQGAIEKFDPEKLEELGKKLEGLEGMADLPNKIVELEKNIKQINEPVEKEREELVKNLKTNQDIISEDSLVKMNIEDLRNLDKKYQKAPDGSFGTDISGDDVVAQINAEYGTNVGATLNQAQGDS